MKQAVLMAAAIAASIACGCSKSADTASNAAASDSAATAAAASGDAVTGTASPDVEMTAGGVSVTQGSNSASFGAGTAQDLKAVGLPVYTGIDPAAATVMKNSDGDEKTIMVMARTTDDFDAVDGWYKDRLGADFQATRVNMGIVKVTTYKKESGGSEMSVNLAAGKNPTDGKSIVSITLLSKTKP
jgi:hypothetical protein